MIDEHFVVCGSYAKNPPKYGEAIIMYKKINKTNFN